MTQHTAGEALDDLQECRKAFEEAFGHDGTLRVGDGYAYGNSDWETWKTAWQARGEYEHTRSTTPAPEAVEMVRAALTDALGCFDAANAEGLEDKLREADIHDTGSLADLVFRRLLHAPNHVTEALALLPSFAPAQEPVKVGVVEAIQRAIVAFVDDLPGTSRFAFVLFSQRLALARRIATNLHKPLPAEEREKLVDGMTEAIREALIEGSLKPEYLAEVALAAIERLVPPPATPTEEMCRRARGFIMGLDLSCRTWGAMQKHLDRGGYPTLPRIRELAEKEPTGHITKWDVAECVYLLMTTEPQQAGEDA